jgi:nitroimidazol reductase NimA-like FMN-containing flavoprotein (pyridoxamine 5'-phosphate oxidase superfamily)
MKNIPTKGRCPMFREMRRKDRLLSNDEAREILERNDFGVLAVLGDAGYPYAVPLNYVFVDGSIYFHGARTGHKIDAIKKMKRYLSQSWTPKKSLLKNSRPTTKALSLSARLGCLAMILY